METECDKSQYSLGSNGWGVSRTLGKNRCALSNPANTDRVPVSGWSYNDGLTSPQSCAPQSPSRPPERLPSSTPTVWAPSTPQETSPAGARCSNTRPLTAISWLLLAIMTGVSRRVLKVKGHRWPVAVRPPCAPQTPEPGQERRQARHLGDTGMAETGHISGA